MQGRIERMDDWKVKTPKWWQKLIIEEECYSFWKQTNKQNVFFTKYNHYPSKNIFLLGTHISLLPSSQTHFFWFSSPTSDRVSSYVLYLNISVWVRGLFHIVAFPSHPTPGPIGIYSARFIENLLVHWFFKTDCQVRIRKCLIAVFCFFFTINTLVFTQILFY